MSVRLTDMQVDDSQAMGRRQLTFRAVIDEDDFGRSAAMTPKDFLAGLQLAINALDKGDPLLFLKETGLACSCQFCACTGVVWPVGAVCAACAAPGHSPDVREIETVIVPVAAGKSLPHGLENVGNGVICNGVMHLGHPGAGAPGAQGGSWRCTCIQQNPFFNSTAAQIIKGAKAFYKANSANP